MKTRPYTTWPAFFAAALLVLLSPPSMALSETGIQDQDLREALHKSLSEGGDVGSPVRPFSVVIRGGLSLGVYEAGVNWALLRLLKDLRADTTASPRVEPHLLAAAGASAGAINGFLAGMFWCSELSEAPASPGSIDDNLFRNTWVKIDVNRLAHHGNDSLPEDNAAFSRVLVREIQDEVISQIEARRFRDGCEVAFGLSLTRSKPVLVNNAGVDVSQQRLLLPMKMRGTADGLLRIENFELPDPKFPASTPSELADRPFLSSVVYLDGEEPGDVLDSRLTPNDVFDAIKASSSFPVAFAPKKLSYCVFQSNSLRLTQSLRLGRQTGAGVDNVCPPQYRRLSSFFVDGGVFDNDPLELVRQLSEQRAINNGSESVVRYIKISPRKRRPPAGLFHFEIPDYGQPGDSLELTLWASHANHRPNDIDTETAIVRHCRRDVSLDRDGADWQAIGDHPVLLTELSINSRLFVGSVHTSSESTTSSGYLPGADIRVSPGDRLLVYSDKETTPSCEEPANLRNSTISQRSIGILADTPQGLSTQLGFLGGSVNSARGFRLHDELMRNNWHDGVYGEPSVSSNALFQPARLTPLVGDFLLAFGAFIDPRFRDFDYYAGVYDAVFGVAEFLCVASEANGDRDDCRAEFAERIYLHLCAPGEDEQAHACRTGHEVANAVLYQLVVLEVCGVDAARNIFQSSCELGKWSWVEKLRPASDWSPESLELLLVGSALQHSFEVVRGTDRDPFLRFVRTLAAHRAELEHDPNSELLNRMLARSDRRDATWYYPLARNVIPKLLQLEDSDKALRDQVASDPAGSRAGIKMGLALGGLVSESIMKDEHGWLPDQTSVPGYAKRRWLASVVPSELAVDSRNGGAAVYWNPGWRLKNKWGLDFRLGPYLRQRFSDSTIEFSEATALVTRRTENPLLSSVGLGPTYTHTWGNADFAKNDTLGASLSIGLFADKLRLTHGVRSFSREDFAGDDIYTHIGVNDLPGIFYWMCRGADDPPGIFSWLCAEDR